MPNLNDTFQGSVLIIPGAYYADNVSADLPALPPPTPPLIFVGFGYGPKPFTINKYSSTAALQSALRGGPASAFIPFIATPSPELNGAQNLVFIDVSNSTPATASITTTAAAPYVNMTSNLYGLPSNLLQFSVGPSTVGTNNGSNTQAILGRKVTIYDGYSNQQYQGDNLGVPFQLAYTGTATGSLTYTVTATGGAGAATVFAVSSPHSNESFSIPLGAGGYATVSAVISYLNGTGFWLASSLSATGGQLPSQNLDPAAAITLSPVSSGGVPVYGFATAVQQDIEYWLNNFTGGLITAVSASGTTSPTSVAAATLTHFTGGMSIPPITSGYAAGFALADTTPGWVMIADSALPAVQQLGTQSALLASEPGFGSWRRFVTGSQLGDTVATTILNATYMDAIEGTYVYPGISRASPTTGVVTLYPGVYAAAAVAAMMTGNGPNTPLTRKPLVADTVEVSLSLTQIDQLQQGGVMPVAVVDQSNVPYVVSDFTTWQVDANPENVFNQQVAERFWVAYTMVNTLNPYAGTTADPLDEMKILNAAKAALNALTYSQGNPTGVIVSWDSSTLQLVYTGANQTAAIQVNVVLVGQNRFITMYVPIQPLNVTITASATAA